MSEGGSYETFAALIGVSKQTIYDWEKVNKAWREAKEIAWVKCQLWWEEQGKNGLWSQHQGTNINATVWLFNMKNRFGWRDKKETTSSFSFSKEDVKKMSTEEIKTLAADIIGDVGSGEE